MATETKNVGEVDYTTSMTNENAILVEIDSKIYRIKLSDLATVIQSEGVVLSQIAWGIPVKQGVQSATNWGVVGNTSLRDAYESKCGRYLVTNDGIAVKLAKTNMGNPAAGTVLCTDGTTLNQNLGHIMVIAPRLYYLWQVIDGLPYIWLSESPISSHYLETADGYMCQGAFPAYVSSGKLTSIMNVVPSSSLTISQFWNYAQANGKSWGLCDYDNCQKWNWLYSVGHYGNTNIQANLGNGLCGEGDNWVYASTQTTGATALLGDSFGKVNVGTGTNACHVNLGGIENPYGLRWGVTQGAYFGSVSNSGQLGTEMFIYKGNRLPNSTELTTKPNGIYRQITRMTTNNWIKSIVGGSDFDVIPSALGGSATEYLSDYNYQDNTGQLLLWGGSAGSGFYCGVACSGGCNAFSDAGADIGSRLAYYGKLTFKDGRELL